MQEEEGGGEDVEGGEDVGVVKEEEEFCHPYHPYQTPILILRI